jgi:GDP/UDP-N,N'-diacetylbacillosamine 2-epimerase (hydrolysing)
MKIGVLTSSRADFGIYYPLLSLLKTDSSFDLEIIAFGTHLQQKYGYTVDEIAASLGKDPSEMSIDDINDWVGN